MNFNLFNLKQLFVVLLMPVFGCGLKYGEKVKPTDVVEFKNGSCLSNSNKITKSFFNGEAEEAQVAEAVDCYSNVIETFRDNVRGAEAQAFSPEEIQVFLKNNFMKDSDFDLSVSLVEELMKLKVVIAGGTRFRVTHGELTELSQSLREIKPDIVSLNPVMPLAVGLDEIDAYKVLTENQKLQIEFNEKTKLFTNQLVKLSRIFKYAHLNYRVEELYQLIVQVLRSNHNSPETIEKFESLKPLVSKVSQILIDDRQVLDAQSWPRLLSALGDGYMAYRRYELLVNDQTKDTGLDEIALQKIISGVHPTLATLISQKPTASVTDIEIHQLLVESKILFTQKFLDSPDLAKWVQKIIDLKSYFQLTSLLWSHVLNDPVQRLQGKPTNHLDAVALKTVADELGYLFRSQANVKRMFLALKLQGSPATRLAIKSYLNELSTSLMSEELDFLFANEQLKMYDAPAIMVFDESHYLKISDPSNIAADAIYQISDIEKSNYARAGARLLIRAFSSNLDSALFIKQVTKVDTEMAWNLVRPIVNELDFVQPDNLTFISSRFREADLFISSSNGDNIGQFTEMHDLILHIYSGKNRSDVLRKDIVEQCLPESDPESFKPKDSIDEVCLIQHYVTATNGFQSMPRYIDLISTSAQDMPLFAMSLLKAAGHEPNPEHLVKFEDLDLYPHVAQYIEMLFSKFDTNRDGVLDKFEAVRAYATYEKTVAEVLEKLGVDGVFPQPERRMGIFLYLLKMGRFYEGKEEFKEFQKFINDQRDINTTDKWNMSATRITLGRLFNFLADKLNKPEEKKSN